MPEKKILPTRRYIRNTITYGLHSNDEKKYRRMIYTNSRNVPPDEAEQIICGNKKGIRSFFISKAFKYRELISKIPLLGGFAMKVKERMFDNAVNKIKAKDEEALDLSAIMQLKGGAFIQALFRMALDREPDPEGFDTYLRMQALGCCNEAIAYVITVSEEFGQRAKVLHLEEYKKAYTHFSRAGFFKKAPVTGWFWRSFTMPKRIWRLETESQVKNARLTLKLEEIEAKLERLEQIEEKLTQTEEKVAQLEQKNDALTSLTINAAIRSRTAFSTSPGGVTVVQVGDFIMGVPSEEWRLAMFLSLNGHFEPGTEKCFNTLLKPGMNVVDVGANLGIFTLHAARAGCNVYSYEPTPSTFKLLKDNIGVNGFDPVGNVHAYNLAVAECAKKVSFTICEKVCGHNNMFSEEADEKHIMVEAVALDDHLGHLKAIDVVKIDVEGAEPLVLQGMKHIITQNPDIKIIMEFAPVHLDRANINPGDFIKTIRGAGLDIAEIDENTGLIRAADEGSLVKAYSVNLLLARPGVISQMVRI